MCTVLLKQEYRVITNNDSLYNRLSDEYFFTPNYAKIKSLFLPSVGKVYIEPERKTIVLSRLGSKNYEEESLNEKIIIEEMKEAWRKDNLMIGALSLRMA